MITWVKNGMASILLSTALGGMSVSFAQTVCDDNNIDNDGDGLIEVCYLENLDAIRRVLDGSAYQASATATASTQGCGSGGCKGYELVRNLDFNNDNSYSNPANKVKWTTTSTGGWLPIGDNDNRFSGTFDGNGYTLSGLTIHTMSGDYIGLFGALSSSGTITGINLSGVDVRGDVSVGSLVGRSYGTIHNSHSSGRVIGGNRVGGLVGWNDGTISTATVAGQVSSKDRVGGLVGINIEGTITNSFSTAQVDGSGCCTGGLVGMNWDNGKVFTSYSRGPVNGGNFTGGLVSYNRGIISNSYSRGTVSGRDRVGSLVGINFGSITNSYSSGAVTGDNSGVGGLSGENHGFISNSYSSGSVSGKGNNVGGLVGWNSGGATISNSYSNGSVSGNNYNVGGLVGANHGTINNSYSQRQVSGTSDRIGGLVGHHLAGTIRNSYSRGLVVGTGDFIGGLVGQSDGATVNHSYWDIAASGLLTSAAGTSKTTVQLQAPTTASGIYSEWSEDDWYFGTSDEYPAIKYSMGTDASNLACDIPQQPPCDSLLAGQGRVLITISTQTPVRRANAVESDIIVLKAAPGHSISGTTTERRFVVRSNLVGREATIRVETYEADVNDGANTHQITVLVMVEKVNNGQAVWSIRQNGNDLTVARSSLDPDGVADVSSINYQWQKCLVGEECSGETGWRDVGSTASSYSVAEAERKRNNRFRVVVRYRDGQGYAEEVVAFTTYSISSVSSAPTFTGDWNEFEGGAAAVCNDADIDNDNDGLIEICHLEDLDAIRHAPEGSGYQPYSDAAKSTKGCGAGGCNGYELVRNLDFAADASYLSTANQVRWTTGTGWLPISPGLSSTFNGNGYTLSGLMINRNSRESFADRVGLFASLSSRGVIDEVGLLNVDVRGRNQVGSLVGENDGGTISNSHSRGSASGNWRVGGLVGENGGGTISNSYSRGSVNGSRWVGGLVGENDRGTISNSYSSGLVSSEGRYVGGLVGQNVRGHISKSHSSGQVHGDVWVGGLVGENYEGTINRSYSSESLSRGSFVVGGLAGKNIRGSIMNSHSSGSVSGIGQLGGLVGENTRGTISNSHNSGPVSGDNQSIGGLVGLNHGIISNSYNSGSARGNHLVGGLIGDNYGVISSSYSSGVVNGRRGSVGGLVGRNRGTIRNSYSRSLVTGTGDFIGGLVGRSDGTTVSHSYWDITASRLLTSAAGTSKTTVQLQTPITASGIYREWSEDDWHFGTRTEYPAVKYSTGTDASNLACGTPQQPPCDSLLAGQGRVLITISTQTPVRRANAVEGNIIVLKAAPGHSISGTTTEHRFVVRSNLVGREATTGVQTYEVDVNDGTNTYQITILVMAEKANNGQAVWSIRQNGNDLMVSLLTDPDGAADVSSISYQWQKCLEGNDCASETGWSNVGSTASSYSVVAAERKRNSRFRAIVRYHDGQGYAEEVITEPIIYFVSLVSSAPTFTRDWSEFEGGAIAVCDDADIDNDDDGLIEICHLEDLDTMRLVLDGSGYQFDLAAPKSVQGCASDSCRGYELVRDLNFNTDADYRSTAHKVKWTTMSTGGWLPIGNNDNRFSGTFDGNGYTLSGLTIHTTADYVGLFGVLSSSGTITGINLSDVAVHGNDRVGSLVGWSYGTITTSSYRYGLVSGNERIGGLVGQNSGSGTIAYSHSSGATSSTQRIGGLVGTNFGIIRNSYSSGPVNGRKNGVGGLVGENVGTIAYSYSSGATNGTLWVGGLVGTNFSIIRNSYSTGLVTGGDQIGGLVGWNVGMISNSYSSELVTGTRDIIGGLVGQNRGTIAYSYSTGSVTGDEQIGGLAGLNVGMISNSYSSGSVNSNRVVGGLVGNNSGIISNSYSSGSVSADLDSVGGLAGYNEGTIINSYSSSSARGGGFRVGGLVGWNFPDGEIFNSYSSGLVSGSNPNVGGLVGANQGTISNSYSQAHVSGTRDQVGGLVGHHISGTISNSYSSGLVTGTGDFIGGLVGRSDGTTVSYSYWDITTSKQLTSAAGISKTTVQLQAPTAASDIYSEWSEDDWYFGTSVEYPALRHTTGTDADNPACDIEQQPPCDSLLAGQGRVLVVLSAQTQIRRAAAMEGDIIVLKAAPSHSILGTTQTERRFAVPPDFVGREATTGVQTYQVDVNDGTNTHQITVLIIVEKVNNGQAVWSIRQNGNDLTVARSSLDQDGVADVSSISYQWQKCLVGEGCSGETGWRDAESTTSSYSVVAAERKRDNLFRIIVRYRDGQGYAEEVSASIVYSISSVSSAPPFTGDWSQFAGGAAAVCNDADIDNDNDGLIEICHLEDLDAIRHAPDGSGYQLHSDVAKSTKGCGAGGCKGYELVRNLDFAADDSYLSTANRVRWTKGTGWLPISPGLSGTFDGNGYTLSGLVIDRSGRESFADHVGLFSSLSSRGVIEEIGLLNTEVRGRNWVGGLVGENNGGTISNSYSRGSVSGNWYVGSLVGWNNGTITDSYSRGSVNGSQWVGGLVGENDGGTISNSYSSVSVRGNDYRAGGLVGENTWGTISNSYSSGSVSGYFYVGGLVGSNYGTISSSYSRGVVSGLRSSVGGLVGWNRGTINNSYSRSSVNGTHQVGGLAGYNYRATISNSYSIGQVRGRVDVGGLAGRNIEGMIIGSYWDITTSRLLTSDGGTSKTIVELQTPTNSTGIYSTWSSDIWDFGTAIQYPALKYTTGTDANNLLCGIEGQPPCGSLLAGVEQRIRHIAISTATVRAHVVEGEIVVLNAAIGNWTYQWDIPGNVRTLSTTDTAELRFVVPTDLVEREATTDMLTLELTISTGTARSTEYNIEIIAVKAENGLMNPTITRSENTLTQMGTDPDGDVMIEAYQWQRCLGSSATVVCSDEDSWEDVSTSTSYSLSAEDAVVGNRFRVRLTYTDGQGYRATVTSAAFTYPELVVPRRAIFVRLKLFLEGALQ